MGDPFSVAGTAVGITSLGIQTCQILYNYYSEARGFHNDIDNLLLQIEGLQGILDSLQQIQRRIEADNHAPSSQLRLAVEACKGALEQLKEMTDKCNTTKRPVNLQARLRDAKKRLSWPFKKETLGALQANLSRFQDNLTLALQCAGLDAVLQKIDDVRPTLDALHEQSTDMEQYLIHQTHKLRSLHHDVNQVSVFQQQVMFRELSELRTQMSHQDATVRRKLDLLICSSSSTRDLATISPSIVAGASQTFAEAEPQVRNSLQQYNTRIQQTQTLRLINNMHSTCQCRFKKKQSWKRGRWVSTLLEEESYHRPECPQFAHADYSQSVAAQFTLYSRFVGFCVQAGWQCSRRGGWNTIAPVLRYRNVVSRNSGAFEILEDAYFAVWRVRGQDQDEFAEILSTTFEILQRSFAKEISPTDITPIGESILHSALGLMSTLIDRNYCDVDAFCAFIDMCITQGVPCDQISSYDLSPVRLWQVSMIFMSAIANYRSFHDVLIHLTRRSSNWSILQYRADIYSRPCAKNLYHSLWEVLKTEDCSNGLDEDDSLVRSLLRRSEEDLRFYLSTINTEKLKTLLESRRNLASIVCWPNGLEILISYGPATRSTAFIAELWDLAVQIGNSESLLLLLRFDVRINWNCWNTLNKGWTLDWPALTAVSKPERTRRSKVLHTVAVALLAHRSKPIESQQILDTRSTSERVSEEPSLYHSLYLRCEAAEIAWDAGHCNVDSPQWIDAYYREDETIYSTPLWSSTALDYDIPIKKWLINHGANTAWLHSKFLTTPIHNIFRYPYPRNIDEDFKFLSNLLVSPIRDGCKCHCSRGGCLTIGCATSKRGYRGIMLQNTVVPLVDQNRDKAWMSTAVIRVLTFEKLSLTHTCCYRLKDEVRGLFARPTPEEAEVIYDHERDEIALLETLVTEFEQAWATYIWPFRTFLKRVWRPRMLQVLQKHQVEKHVYEDELRRMGVILKDPDEESDSDSDTESWLSDDSTESEGDGWHTTDGEDEDEDEDEDPKSSGVGGDPRDIIEDV